MILHPVLSLLRERTGCGCWFYASALDLELRVEPHGAGKVEIVRRGFHHVLVNLTELLRRPVACDADDVLKRFVAGLDGGVDAEKAAQIELALRLDLKLAQRDA